MTGSPTTTSARRRCGPRWPPRGHDALLLFAADKISIIRALRDVQRRGIDDDVTPGSAQKLSQYHPSADLLEELEPDAPLVRRLRHELDQLDAELAQRRHAELAR
jgi:hypothetical protein